MHIAKYALTTIAFAFSSAFVYAQQINSNNQGLSQKYSNTITDTWTFSVNPGLGFVVNSHATPGTADSRIATNFSGRYYFGNFGIGISGGIMAGRITNNAVNTFLSERNFPIDATVVKSNPSNNYLLFGPAIRFGKKVQFGAELSGGLFLNDAGSLSVTPLGAPRSLYNLENGNKNLFPGFSGNIHIDYPINHSTRFFISTGYMQTKTSTRVLDMKQGIDIPRLQNQDLKLFTAGIGISKTFGGRKGGISDGLSAGKIKNGGMVKGNINVGNAYRTEQKGSLKGKIMDNAPGTANFRALREPPTETYNPWEMDDDAEGTVINPIFGNDGNNTSSSSSCGPVTQKTTNPDGTVTETTFACPEDAAKYNNAQGPDQFPWHVPRNRTSGEKAGNGLQSGANPVNKLFQKDTVSNNILFGKVSYWPSAAEAYGIATNKSKGIGGTTAKPGGMTSSSYAAGKMSNPQNGHGIISHFYSRDASSGLATGKRARTKDAGNGLATGRRQYQLIYTDESNGTSNNSETDIVVNPLYKPNGNSGYNPLFESNQKLLSSGGGDLDSDGIPELRISLIDPENGAVLATTKTEANGDFYFANLPTGTYAVELEGTVNEKKSYDVSLKKKLDIAGQILSGHDSWAIELNTGKGSAEQAAAYVKKTRTKSNSSNDRLTGNTNDNSGIVWSPKSNFKILPINEADTDGDGRPDILIGNEFQHGNISHPVVLRPGNPIGGIIVKGGKNPGGSMITTTTNNNGEFEFPKLKAGNYTIIVEQTIVLSDETYVMVGDEQNNSLSKSSVQDHNSSRSNKTSVIAPNDDDDDNNNSKVIVRGWDPVKKESIQRNVNTSEKNLQSLSSELDNLEQRVKRTRRNIWGSGGASNKVENLRAAIADVQQTLNTLQQKDKETALSELDQKTSVMNMKFTELQKTLSGMGNEYTSISNALKTKHDTVKNSINNVR